MRLLAVQGHASLADISTWADEHRNPTTAAWHYVNFPRDDCQYVPERDCAGGNCVVAAIERQVRAFEQASNDEARLLALKYLVHLVADVHQPLHAGFADDRGGNTYQVQFMAQGTNLHALWDSGLIRYLGVASAVPPASGPTTPPIAPAAWNTGTPAQAAQESCRIVSAEGFYPPRRAGPEYAERYAPMLEQRLHQAGLRLGLLLGQLLAKP